MISPTSSTSLTSSPTVLLFSHSLLAKACQECLLHLLFSLSSAILKVTVVSIQVFAQTITFISIPTLCFIFPPTVLITNVCYVYLFVA